jgi:hypothetical protein
MNGHFAETNPTAIQFLLADLDTALTFMDLAATGGDGKPQLQKRPPRIRHRLTPAGTPHVRCQSA